MIDFNKFRLELKEATKKSFLKLVNEPDLYAFALLSDENCQTILPVANTCAFLEQARIEYDDEECLDCKFNPDEWDYTILEDEVEFIKLTKLLAKEDEENKSEEEFLLFQKQFYNTCYQVLLELKNEDFFQNNYKKDVFLIFSVSEYEFDRQHILSMIENLNSSKFAKEYADWMHTWGN